MPGEETSPSGFVRPKELSLHNTDMANPTADFVGYDGVAGLALLQEEDDLVLLGRCSTHHRTDPLVKVHSNATLYHPSRSRDTNEVNWTIPK